MLSKRPSSYSGLGPRQRDLWSLLCGPATHILAYGGARSGKTYCVLRNVCARHMMVPDTSAIILRFRFNHLKASIINDTLPAVMKNEFPEARWKLNKTDWFVDMDGGYGGSSRLYFGGLDDADRTEKILGQGHSTIYLNECSQISYASRIKAVTRLSQNKGLRLKAYYDENPPLQGHWTHRLFIKKQEPMSGAALPNPEEYAAIQLNPRDNSYLPAATIKILESLPLKERTRFLDGLFGVAIESALWSYDVIESCRWPEGTALPTMTQLVVSVDPSGCRGKEDKRSDLVGIVVVGKDDNGVTHVLEDASGRYAPGGATGWGAMAVGLYHKYRADCVIAEVNFGGAMVQHVISTTDPNVPFREVIASRGKAVRADPVSTLYARGLVRHYKPMAELEEELVNFSTAGYQGEKSPDRADAMVWGVTALGIDRAPGIGMLDFYREEAAKLKMVSETSRPPVELGWSFSDGVVSTDQLVSLRRGDNATSTVYGMDGRRYLVDDSGLIRVAQDDVAPLLQAGFTLAT